MSLRYTKAPWPSVIAPDFRSMCRDSALSLCSPVLPTQLSSEPTEFRLGAIFAVRSCYSVDFTTWSCHFLELCSEQAREKSSIPLATIYSVSPNWVDHSAQYLAVCSLRWGSRRFSPMGSLRSVPAALIVFRTRHRKYPLLVQST